MRPLLLLALISHFYLLNISLSILNCSLYDSKFPIWSRGLARSCCNVYPKDIGKRYKTKYYHIHGLYAYTEYPSLQFETGSTIDPNYIYKHAKLNDGDIVYVITSEFYVFMKLFYTLPTTARITLVTGCEDIGAPWEVFHPNRTLYTPATLQQTPYQHISIRQFLRDTRLVTWYTQNYDLLGCNQFTCSDLNISHLPDRQLLSKVIPIPIGLDLHTIAEKPVKKVTPSKTAQQQSICQQTDELQLLSSAQPSLLSRPVVILAQFSCAFKGNPNLVATRGELCILLTSPPQRSKHTNGSISAYSITYDKPDSYGTLSEALNPTSVHSVPVASSLIWYIPPGNLKNSRKRDSRSIFWSNLRHTVYALAPSGNGIDTHRIWEILHMHTIPIILTSTLDILYRQYPIIILNNWSELCSFDTILSHTKRLIHVFGPEPFFNSTVRAKLTLRYWVELIKQGGRK